MWRPDQTSCTHFPGLPGLIRSRRRTTTDHQTRVLLFCLQSDVFSHHLPLDWPLTVKGKKEKKTFRSTVGEVKPGQSLILKIEPEEDFQQRKSPQHNTASSWEPPVNNNKLDWMGNTREQPPPPPQCLMLLGGRQSFRTGLLLFQSILKLHSCVHSFAERLTGGLYLFLLSVAKRLHHILFPIKVIGNSSLLLWSSLRCCLGLYLGGNKKNELGWKRLDHWKIPEVSYQRLHNVWDEPYKNKLRRRLKKNDAGW